MPKQPWMKRRADETVKEYHERLNRTCYGCGKEFANSSATDNHENSCPKIPDRSRNK